MVISCQKGEKECMWVKYLIYVFCRNFKFFVIFAFFPPNLYSQISEFTKNVFSKSACQAGGQNYRQAGWPKLGLSWPNDRQAATLLATSWPPHQISLIRLTAAVCASLLLNISLYSHLEVDSLFR